MQATQTTRRGSTPPLTITKPHAEREANRTPVRPALRRLIALGEGVLAWGAAYAGVMLLFALVGLLTNL